MPKNPRTRRCCHSWPGDWSGTDTICACAATCASARPICGTVERNGGPTARAADSAPCATTSPACLWMPGNCRSSSAATGAWERPAPHLGHVVLGGRLSPAQGPRPGRDGPPQTSFPEHGVDGSTEFQTGSVHRIAAGQNRTQSGPAGSDPGLTATFRLPWLSTNYERCKLPIPPIQKTRIPRHISTERKGFLLSNLFYSICYFLTQPASP